MNCILYVGHLSISEVVDESKDPVDEGKYQEEDKSAFCWYLLADPEKKRIIVDYNNYLSNINSL